MEDESAISVYSDRVKECIEAIPQAILDMSEEKLRKHIDPNIKLYEVKRAFWEEVVLSQDSNKRMTVARVYEGKMGKEHFYTTISDPYKMAWIVSPLTTYEDRTQAALDKVSIRYEELINMEITSHKKIKNDEGEWEWIEEVDAKKALVLLQVIKNLEDRIKGTSVQRQVSVHTNRPTDSAGVGVGTMNMKAVEDKLKELEGKLGDGDGFKEGNAVACGDAGAVGGEGEGVERQAKRQVSNDDIEGEVGNGKDVDIQRGDYRQID